MHLQEKDLELYVLGQLSPGRVSTIEAHLLGCTSCGTRLSGTVKSLQQEPPVAGERRRGGRVPTDDPALMHVLHPLSTSRVDIRVLDVSKDGLKLQVPEFLQPGSVIQVRLEHAIALGEVRYCQAAQAGFHAGVQLQDVFDPKNA